MTEHESIREMLALAAAGVLGPDEVRRVEQHASRCESCRTELEAWAAYSQGLRKLPQPPAPEGLLERTRARILQEHEAASEKRRHELQLAGLAAFGWMTSFALWFIVRGFTGGTLIVLGANLGNAWTWLAVSTALSWATAGAAALVLVKREMRSFV